MLSFPSPVKTSGGYLRDVEKVSHPLAAQGTERAVLGAFVGEQKAQSYDKVSSLDLQNCPNILDMNAFPEFMKHPANRLATSFLISRG